MTKLLAKLSRVVIVAVAGLVLASAVKADPLMFSNVTALQNQGFSKVDLFSNSGTTLFGPELSFTVDVTGIPVVVIDSAGSCAIAGFGWLFVFFSFCQ